MPRTPVTCGRSEGPRSRGLAGLLSEVEDRHARVGEARTEYPGRTSGGRSSLSGVTVRLAPAERPQQGTEVRIRDQGPAPPVVELTAHLLLLSTRDPSTLGRGAERGRWPLRTTVSQRGSSRGQPPVVRVERRPAPRASEQKPLQWAGLLLLEQRRATLNLGAGESRSSALVAAHRAATSRADPCTSRGCAPVEPTTTCRGRCAAVHGRLLADLVHAVDVKVRDEA